MCRMRFSDGLGGGVYMSLSSRGKIVVVLRAKIKSAEHAPAL